MKRTLGLLASWALLIAALGICAIDFPRAKSGACHGDSGGPLFTRGPHKGGGWIEIGIVEAGFGKCTTRRPQLFTRTDLLSRWIHSRVEEIESAP